LGGSGWGRGGQCLWKWAGSGRYSSKSAYLTLSQLPREDSAARRSTSVGLLRTAPLQVPRLVVLATEVLDGGPPAAARAPYAHPLSPLWNEPGDS
jgi:hypothetical protein